MRIQSNFFRILDIRSSGNHCVSRSCSFIIVIFYFPYKILFWRFLRDYFVNNMFLVDGTFGFKNCWGLKFEPSYLAMKTHETVRGELVRTDWVPTMDFCRLRLTSLLCSTNLGGIGGLLRIYVGAKVFWLLVGELAVRDTLFLEFSRNLEFFSWLNFLFVSILGFYLRFNNIFPI